MDVETILVFLALFEDSGFGDITTDSLVENEARGKGVIITKEDIVVSGMPVASKVFRMTDTESTVTHCFKNGESAEKGSVLCEVTGTLAGMLKGERVALNFLQHLCGIATFTRSVVARTAGTDVKVSDTRKTTPGWRHLEKSAVRHGGGFNHRMALYDGVLIKDNHISVAGGIKNAIDKIRPHVSHLMKIEVEVSSFQQVKEAVAARADVIMLDNMDTGEMKRAVAFIGGRAVVEASGNVSRENIHEVALTGVDIISSGALTHHAPAVDLSMNITRL